MNETETVFPDLDETVVATARYLGALSELTDEDMRAPSLLPGWTRGHVVTHLARNADALRNVMLGAEAGETRAMYESREQRDADIEAGAKRPAAALRADAVASAGRWVQAANELHVSHLDATGTRVPGGDSFPVRRVGWLRRVEVEVHHADLDIGYTPLEWPDDLVDRLLERRRKELTEAGHHFDLAPLDREHKLTVGDGGPVVSGPAVDLVWWLLGRGSGEGLRSSSATLPDIGRWI